MATSPAPVERVIVLPELAMMEPRMRMSFPRKLGLALLTGVVALATAITSGALPW